MPSAMAADLIPTVYQPAPVAPIVMSSWYLRGDIGFSNQEVDQLDNELYDTVESLDAVHRDFTGAPFVAGGIGYRWNKWFRTDITGEYRSKSEFNGADIYTAFNGDGELVSRPDSYFAKKSEYVGLVNAYVDLGSWHGITPFVGAGVGGANVEISSFTDIGVGVDGSPSIAYGDDHDEWNFAWAVHAGLAFEVTPEFTMELAYRYLDLGDGESGDLVAFDGTNNVDNPMEFEDITSHDVKVGFRYMFN
jgi:opacity protein-like surface antigen